MNAEPRLELETPERVAVSLELAGLGARAFAWLLDALLVFLCWMMAFFVYSFWGDLLRRWQALSVAGQFLGVGAVVMTGWGWDVAWELLAGGRTPGKRAMGLRVVRIDGGPVGLAESLGRNLLRAVELPLGYAPGILMVALGPRRQRAGDLVAGTLVVRERRFDLSRYGAVPADRERFAPLRGRAPALLSAAEYDRLVDFLRRRPELEGEARGRLAARLAAAFARRAALAPPSGADAEPFLEALVAFYAEGA
ncbi:MAG TPA: RDD family protein [Anaeromyxobacteraceae bacterium]|nr:RDD family protein [Anaeromyxobacteraceae bacterium]